MNNLIKTILTTLLLTLGASQTYAEQKITFYHYDLLGSPVATTDENGAVTWREEYSPWGEKLLKEDGAHDNVRGYTGHVNDKETGLTYMQARYYDPQIGRFMGVDPVGFQETSTFSFNRYAYANNNPYKFKDPNGKWATKAHNYFIDKFSNKYNFSTNAVKSIKAGSKHADSLQFQFGNSAHMHGMGNGKNTIKEQQKKMNNFIQQKMQRYNNLLGKAELVSNSKGLRMKSTEEELKKQAYHELGMALHAAMDSTSPAHKGYQVWSWNKETVTRHGDFKTSLEDLEAAQSEENTENTLEAMDNVMNDIEF